MTTLIRLDPTPVHDCHGNRVRSHFEVQPRRTAESKIVWVLQPNDGRLNPGPLKDLADGEMTVTSCPHCAEVLEDVSLAAPEFFETTLHPEAPAAPQGGEKPQDIAAPKRWTKVLKVPAEVKA